MVAVKTIRLRSDRAKWLLAEAERAEVSQNRIIEELISEAIRDKWQFGKSRYVLEMHAETVIPGER